MPRIKDFAYANTTSTTGKTITCDVPFWETGDILVAILSTDTGITQAWTASGWTQYVSGSNTVNLAVMWRVATGVAATVTFTYSTAETANAMIISIEDCDTTTPVAHHNASNIASASDLVVSTTPTRNNSLLLWAAANINIAVIPSIIEGAVTQIISKDGAAHSDCVAWGFQPLSGNSGNIAKTSVSGTSYTGRCIALSINPPSTGALVVPTYCCADASILLDPLHGTTAFRGNTAPGGTATTYFGTSIKSLTLANATISAKTDYGINSFRSCSGMTGPTTKSMQGIALNMLNALTTHAGKNILAHCMPLLPADMQTVHNVGSGLGIFFGAYTSAGNFKVWHVHGADTSFGSNRAPVVINTSNTSGVVQTTGTLNPDSIKGFGFMTSGFLASSDWVWSMIWALDTCTVAGGNAAFPADITGIRIAVADGHERMSAIQSGASQLLLLQPVKFGDGGIHPIYLNLDSTAIEFPEQYNREAKNVFYCGADNVVGLTYHAGAADTIKHTNAIVSSKSKFHWNIDAASSASASYDFKGLSIIGAGIVTLRAVTIFDSMSFSLCPSITQNSANITKSIFNDSIISSNLLSAISYCSFTKGSINKNAIVVTTPGTYSFSGNSFTGYGTTGTDTAAIYNNSGGLVTINISNGSTPTYYNGVGATTVINNNVSVTLEANVSLVGSEIRIYDLDNSPVNSLGTELTGIESCVGATYLFSSSVGNSVWIQVMKSGYEEFGRQYTMPTTNSPLSITLKADNNT